MEELKGNRHRGIHEGQNVQEANGGIKTNHQSEVESTAVMCNSSHDVQGETQNVVHIGQESQAPLR